MTLRNEIKKRCERVCYEQVPRLEKLLLQSDKYNAERKKGHHQAGQKRVLETLCR